VYIAVCDNQAEALDLVAELLSRWQQKNQIALHFKTFQSASEMLDAAIKENFTLYLLDVMMPGMDGLTAAREIRAFDATAEIVFLTSSPGFAYESYGVRAMEYLLKPINSQLLFPILDKLALREQKPQEGLVIKNGSTLVRILFSQLSHVEVCRKRLYFNLADGSVYEEHGVLSNYEPQLLARTEFIRIHRSYIVNMLQIAELSPSGIRTFTGQNLPVSRLLYSELQKRYMQLLFAERRESL